jgi:hypothetical protein
MSLDKQNFARTIQEQQGGIAPQMWPIMCPDNGSLVLNQPYEISINPCDCIWLPATYDKSYGPNPAQSAAGISNYLVNPATMGQNICDLLSTINTPPWITLAPIFGLRFNSPNNPWLLWSLGGTSLNTFSWGVTDTPQTVGPSGTSTMMRSICGPISRLWIQYYSFCFPQVSGANQIVLMSMLGFNQSSMENRSPTVDLGEVLTAPPVQYRNIITCGGYITTQLNTADLQALGVKPAAPGTKA